MKILFTLETCLLFLFFSITSFASVIPEGPDCSAKIRITKILSKTQNRPDVIKFEVLENNCKFLKENGTFSSSSIAYQKSFIALKKGSTYKGQLAKSSTMGPNGLVKWVLFKSPSFSFTFKI